MDKWPNWSVYGGRFRVKSLAELKRIGWPIWCVIRRSSKEINKRISDALIRARESDTKNGTSSRVESVQKKINEIENRKLLYMFNRNIEGGHDVSYFLSYGVSGMMRAIKMRVEIKPIVGDDYPSVLRQMKQEPPLHFNGWDFNESFRCLFVRAYDGEGASKDQFMKLFEMQNYKVVFESEIDAVCLPYYDLEYKYEII